jgi:hypothetical protein
VTSTDVQLALRPPIWARVLFLVWPVVVVAVLFLEFRPNDGGSWATTLFIGLGGSLLCWRLFAQAAIGTGDGRLLVRNVLRSRVVQRDEITGVTVHRARGGSGSGWCVQLQLRDGRGLGLDVTQVPLRGPFRGRIERQAAAVRDWATEQPQPFL